MVKTLMATFAALCLACAVPVSAQNLSPKAIVEQICAVQLTNSDSKKELKTGERKAKLWRLVDQHFDHRGYVMFVAGPTWKNSTPEKQMVFSAAVYKTLDQMVAAVADFFISECAVGDPKLEGKTARVGARMVEKGSDDKPQTHQVTFQLELKGEVWKVVDLLVNGSFSARSALAEKHRKTLVSLLQ